MDIKKIMFILIIAVCIISVSYGIYYQIFETETEIEYTDISSEELTNSSDEFDALFNNTINYQNYTVNNVTKIDKSEELVYTSYELNESYENNYDIKVNIPVINIEGEVIKNINNEIVSIFQDKVSNILSSSSSESQIYTVEYTAYVNENILSLVIKSTLKEGSSAQRVIIKAYTYNLSSNEEITLAEMLEIKGKNLSDIETQIRSTIEASIKYTDSLISLGYSVYERDIDSDIYAIENSNYFLGDDEKIYIIYAYGNSSYTSEKDIVIVE